MLGKVYTVRGFDRYGNVELEPTEYGLDRAGISETSSKEIEYAQAQVKFAS